MNLKKEQRKKKENKSPRGLDDLLDLLTDETNLIYIYG